MSVVNDILKGLSRGVNIRDFQHANKIFVSDNYTLAPKHAYLFHVAFDINSALSRMPTTEKLQMGMLVKSASLPKYNIDVKTLNAYNRPHIVQNKIKYQDVTITFHDDGADVIRDFWYDYMSHYYRDSDYSEPMYKQSTLYNPQQTEYWGYLPAQYNNHGAVERILDSIRIYSLHQKRFTEYVLINPKITNFTHGQHSYSETTGILENTMTIQYEAVLYNYGTVKPGGEPNGFATLNYDKVPSPLTPQGGGTTSILGPGGLLSAATGIGESLQRTTPSIDENGNQVDSPNPNYLGAGLAALKTANNLKGQNLLGLAGAELKNIGQGILSGDSNVLNRLALPKAGGGNGTNSVVQNGNDNLDGIAVQYNGQAGPSGPGGALAGSSLASFSGLNITRSLAVPTPGSPSAPSNPPANNTDAVNKIVSNGEGIGNAELANNPLPPGLDLPKSDIPGVENPIVAAPTNIPVTYAPDYTGPSVVYATDGTSSPVDNLGNVQKPLINGSYGSDVA